MRRSRVLTPVGVARLIARAVLVAKAPESVSEALTALAEQFEDLAASCEMVADMERDPKMDFDSNWLGEMAAELEQQAENTKRDLDAAVADDDPLRVQHTRPGVYPATGCQMA